MEIHLQCEKESKKVEKLIPLLLEFPRVLACLSALVVEV